MQTLKRPAPPTVQQVLSGGSTGAASAELLEGTRALGALSARQAARSLENYAARRSAEADAERQRDDAILNELRARGAIQ
jgi:hypothetical protein